MKKARPVFACECGDHAWTALTQGFVTLFDVADRDIVGNRRWFAHLEGPNWYANRTACEYVDGKKKRPTISLHRVLHPAPKGMLTDHRNGNSIDNRRRNLRDATVSQNAVNRKKRHRGTSKYLGVARYRSGWRALITINGQRKWLGTFESEVDAALAYDRAAIELHGEFARPNFPNAEAA